jgi:transposase
MIEPDKRRAIFLLHEEGMPLREISRRLRISRNTVRMVIKQEGKMPDCVRKDKIEIDQELLERLHQECDGWIQRVHEKLTEEEGVQVCYPTLTRIMREMGISKPHNPRCDRVPDKPGDEMQHDTSPYKIKLSGKRTQVTASLIYLRYSKRRYLRFYRNFNRFGMKCFFHEALMYWEHSANTCIIDNTSLARLRGTGKNAVMCPEMRAFAEHYAFKYACHELGHSDRKAGNERSFWIVETNFFPGRKFKSLEDLNRQALEWSTVRMEHRPAKRTGLIPAKAFEHECKFLTKLPSHLPAPYRNMERDTDQYGYIAYGGNFYWVPGTKRETMKVFVYADKLKIYQHRTCVAEYPLAPDGVKNAHFSPEGQPKSRYQAKKKRSSSQEEKRLRAIGSEMDIYLDYVLKVPGIQRHRFLHQLLAFSRQVTSTVLLKMAQRALKYRISRLETLKRIAWYCMSQGESILPEPEVDEGLQDRPVYQEGCLTDEPDFTVYDQMLQEEDPQEEQEPEKDQDEENDHE